MSLNIRWLTNGDEEIYIVVNSASKISEVYLGIEEIPTEIRHYAERIKNPTFCGPELSGHFGVQSILYPDWPKLCGHHDYHGKNCIAEMCKLYVPNKAFEQCQWMQPEEEQNEP